MRISDWSSDVCSSDLLGARRRGETLSIEIHDTGPGIAAEYHQAIFEEFRRVSPAGTRASGLGLGLAIVKRAADLLGHQVALNSHVGRGSGFSLTVPLLPPGAREDADDVAGFDQLGSASCRERVCQYV